MAKGRIRYVVTGNGTKEGFTKTGIESLKALDAVVFLGTTRTREGTIYNYCVKR